MSSSGEQDRFPAMAWSSSKLLLRAVTLGDADLVSSIVDEHADVYVDVEDANGYTPLHLAARAGSSQLVEVLLNSGATPNSLTRTSSTTPLHLACMHAAANEEAYLRIMQLLISRKADVNAIDYQGATPLHVAAKGNVQCAANALLQTPAMDASVRDKQQRSALQWACILGHSEMAKLLWKRSTGAAPSAHRTNHILEELKRDALLKTQADEKRTAGAKKGKPPTKK